MDKLIRKIQDLGYQKVADICEYLEFELGIVKDPKRVWTISAAFQDISDSTNGFLNEDFFEIDDYRFKDRFKIELERKPIEIHINGSDKEETMYCILKNTGIFIPFSIRIQFRQSTVFRANRLMDFVRIISIFLLPQIQADSDCRSSVTVRERLPDICRTNRLPRERKVSLNKNNGRESGSPCRKICIVTMKSNELYNQQCECY